MKKAAKLTASARRTQRIEICKSYAFILPHFCLLFVFTILPVAIAIVLSFTYFNTLEAPYFIGLDNYVRMFTTDDVFMTALKNTLLLAVLLGPGGYLISMFLAWMISELGDKIRVLMTVLFYAPSISGNVYLIWSVLFSGDMYGYANSILLELGVISSPINWLADTRYMMGIVIVVSLWTSMGTNFLTFVAGFKGIDRQYYEAGMIDGISNRWQELWFITLPIIRPQMLFAAIISISGAFSCGAVSEALCGFPSQDYAVYTLMNHLSDYGGARYEMGYACAITTLLFLMTVGFNLFVQRLIKKIGV